MYKIWWFWMDFVLLYLLWLRNRNFHRMYYIYYCYLKNIGTVYQYIFYEYNKIVTIMILFTYILEVSVGYRILKCYDGVRLDNTFSYIILYRYVRRSHQEKCILMINILAWLKVNFASRIAEITLKNENDTRI